MTLEEAQTVAKICASADGGCGVCVEKLVLQLRDKFPEFGWEIDDDSYGEVVLVTERSRLATKETP